MSNPNDDDESYLVPRGQEKPASDEPIWCKIGQDNQLEFVDWAVIAGIAIEYDRTEPTQRTDKMLIAKLMWLSRQETLKELGK